MVIDEKIIALIGELLGAIFAGSLLYLIPKFKAWIEAKTSKDTQETLKTLIESFVRAAEQLLKNKDDDGTMRMNYVQDKLLEIGIEITSDVISMIEAAVWEVNNQNRKNIPQNIKEV